jgi:hypothetical protein
MQATAHLEFLSRPVREKTDDVASFTEIKYLKYNNIFRGVW